MSLLEFKPCDCGGVATKKVQSYTKRVHEFRFTVHRFPIYRCQECKEISFDEEINITELSEWAYRKQIKHIIWHPRMIEMVNHFH